MNHTEHKSQISSSANLMTGAYVGEGACIESDVILGPNSVVLGQTDHNKPMTKIMVGAVIGANATILSGVTIGTNARVEPGTVVTCSVPPYAIVEGNPAHISGYVEAHEATGILDHITHEVGINPKKQETRVNGVTLHQFRMVPDMRGNLSVGEFEKEIPFLPKRYFLVFGVPSAETRGEHAHIQCEQFLVAVKGSVSVVADDGVTREEFVLNQPHMGLYLPPMTWGIQYRYTPDAVLLVFASHYYDNDDYIRDYSDFQVLVKQLSDT